jgi:hypothetical protein
MKTVKLKNNQLIFAVQELNKKEVSEILDDLTVKEKLRVNKVFKALGAAVEDYDKKRIELINQYGAKDSDGELIKDDQGVVEITDEPLFLSKLQEVLDEENSVEIPVLPYGALSSTKLPFRFMQAFEQIFIEG